MLCEIGWFKLQFVVFDLILVFMGFVDISEVQVMLLCIVDYFKFYGIIVVFIYFVNVQQVEIDVGLLLLMDGWILLLNCEVNGEFNCEFYLFKVCGIVYFNQVCEFVMLSSGIYLLEFYFGEVGVLIGLV